MRQIVDSLAGVAMALWNALWGVALGAIALWGFFLVMGAISPSDPTWLTALMAALAVLAVVHFVHVRRMLADHEHGDLARRVHMLRERRGF